MIIPFHYTSPYAFPLRGTDDFGRNFYRRLDDFFNGRQVIFFANFEEITQEKLVKLLLVYSFSFFLKLCFEKAELIEEFCRF